MDKKRIKKLRETVNWFALRGFGQSVAGTATLATPFVGYAILYHDAIAPYLGGLGGLLSDLAPDRCGPVLEFATRLHLVYFGLLCLGLGTLIYRICAHRVIKAYDDIDDYVERQFPTITARNLRSMYATIAARRKDLRKQFTDFAPWLDRKAEPDLVAARNAYADETDTQLAYEVLRSYYTVYDRHTRWGWAWAAYLLYGVGFALLAVPSLGFTLRVICTILGS